MTTPTQAQIEAADKLAVQIVTLVTNKIGVDGKLYVNDGIVAARAIREMILDNNTTAQVGEADELEFAEADRRTIIERCAQISAAAIRKLKDAT